MLKKYEKTYSIKEMDIMMKEHIREEAEVLRKNLREKRKNNEIEYV